MSNLTSPTFEWKWNLNTIVTLCMFAAAFIAWGYALAEFESGQQQSDANIRRMDSRIERLENSASLLANHELRITGVEKLTVESASDLRALNSTISSLASDVRLATEILKRIESTDRRNSPSR